MDGEDGVGCVRGVEEALIETHLGAAEAFLAGLEEEVDRALDGVAVLAEEARGAHQHGRVGVMTAGVHAVLVLGGEG